MRLIVIRVAGRAQRLQRAHNGSAAVDRCSGEHRLLAPERLEEILASVLDRRQERSERRRQHIAELNKRSPQAPLSRRALGRDPGRSEKGSLRQRPAHVRRCISSFVSRPHPARHRNPRSAGVSMSAAFHQQTISRATAMTNRNARILITGATGQVGRQVIAKLAGDATLDVVASSRTPSGSESPKHGKRFRCPSLTTH